MMLKNLTMLLFALVGFAPATFAQLTLQKVGTSKKVVIPNNATITIKFPTQSYSDTCDCYHAHTGKLLDYKTDNISLALTQEFHRNFDATGVGRATQVGYVYRRGEIATELALNDVIAVSWHKSGRKARRNLGITVLSLSLFHSLVTAPLLPSNIRRTSDFVTLGAFTAGVILTAAPDRKTYHLQQPKNREKKKLWVIEKK